MSTVLSYAEIDFKHRAWLWSQGYWEVPPGLDTTGFDFDWRPDPHDRPYIHQFGTQWQKTGGPRFVVPESEGVKYQSHQRATRLPHPELFTILNQNSTYWVDFDWSWHPDDTEPAFRWIFGNQFAIAEIMPTVEFCVPNAQGVKFVHDISATLKTHSEHWQVLAEIEPFDCTWAPHPYEPPYIYVWGNQHLSAAEMPTVEYHQPGATERKYMDDRRAQLCNNKDNWRILHKISALTFDFDWTPHPWDPPYIYVWGNTRYPAQQMPTIEYHVPGATERKYMSGGEPELEIDHGRWETLYPVDRSKFDWGWIPDPDDPPYIYVWGNQFLGASWMPTVEYHVPDAIGRKFMDDTHATLINDPTCWRINYPVQRDSFDFSWVPHPWEPAYIYTWGNQWHDAEHMPTIEYVVPGATERKYMHQEHVRLEPCPEDFVILHEIENDSFDFSWRPNPHEPAFIYVWGNQWYGPEIMPTIEYHVPGATERKYMTDQVPRLKPSADNWVTNIEIVPDSFDFSWRPNPYESPYIYIWGNQWHDAVIEPTVEYHAPGATQRKYMRDRVAQVPATNENWQVIIPGAQIDFSWRPSPHDPPYIYVWGHKWNPVELDPAIEYRVPGAVDRKYMHDVQADIPVETARWRHLLPGVVFDQTWRPDPREPAYIYVWGHKWAPVEIEPAIEYHMPGATERKYIHDQIVDLVPDMSRWNMLISNAVLDWSWRPDPREPAYIYVWGHKWAPVEIDPAVEYRMPGATDRKYIHDQLVELTPDMSNWRVLVAGADFDWTWRPDPREPAFIYVWGNQWNDAVKEPTVEYHVPGATERKYMHDRVAQVASDRENWRVLVPGAQIDFSWRPDPHSPPYIYVWGNQWNNAETEPTIEYVVPGATERKYMADQLATLVPATEGWQTLIPGVEFDFTWRPNPHSPAYIYVWGNQWNDAVKEPTVEYHVPGATERKYMTDRVAIVPAVSTNWHTLVPGAQIDQSWRPDPDSPPYIYVWGNQWHDAATEPTVEYVVPGATERKYMTDRVAQVPVDMTNWQVHDLQDYGNFDFSWRPNPHSPPQIYQWADNGPTYTVPGATEVVLMERDQNQAPQHVPRYYIQTTLEDLIAEHPQEVFWAARATIDYRDFDWNWRPDRETFRHLNVFGNKLSRDTQTYFVNGPMYHLGYKDINYVTGLELTDTQDLAIAQRMIMDMFFVDLGNTDNNQAFSEFQKRFPDVQRIRYMNSWRDTILRCVKKANTKFIWVLNSRSDYSKFDFDWYPADWQSNMLHVFATQWSHWGNNYLVNAETFEQDSQYIDLIEHLPRINHVKNRVIPVRGCLHDMVYVDFGNRESASNLRSLSSVSRKIYTVPYAGSYIQTLRNWLNENSALTLKRDYQVWLVNSITDYTEFDWSWHSDPFQREQLHVFASRSATAKQKFGDTLFVNVSELKNHLAEMDELEAYPRKVNYIGHISAPRLPHPVVSHTYDSQAQAVAHLTDESWPYQELRTPDCPENPPAVVPSVWGGSHASVIVPTTGASQIVVPWQATDTIRTEIYDYDNIVKQQPLAASRLLDIVFISNGEPIAEQNYAHLEKTLRDRNIRNRVIRVSNVNGRVASQHAAAQQAKTAWYFLVNGKVQVREDFDWSWQPDRLQQPKHYIFTVTNPVNGLEYGHQAIVANNRDLTLNTVVRGLDFTLDSLHEVVNVNCGVALYNTDAWTAWRTAFRESIKLRSNTDQFSRIRLDTWLSPGRGDFAEWSQRGAQDGVQYWESVNGDLDKLMLSYDWDWIQQYYRTRYGN